MNRKKRNSRAGFTLAETLMAVLIMLLVSSIVAAGIPAAKNAYEKVVLASNAEVMLSTAESALRDELGTAWNVQPVSNTSITYFSADTGMRSMLAMVDGDLTITEYQEADDDDKLKKLGIEGPDSSSVSRKLVYQSNSDLVQLHVQASFAVDASNKMVTVSGLCVKNGDKTMAEWKDNSGPSFDIPVFSIAPVNGNAYTEEPKNDDGLGVGE